MATTNLRDYRHADRLFLSDHYKLVPKFGFLFHVFFDINIIASTYDNENPNHKKEIGMLVKAIDLPKFTIDTKTHNAYNRPNIVQSKIKYDSINATFHDDSADIIRNFWFDYYNYYYRDADHELPIYTRAHKYSITDFNPEWGFTPRRVDAIPYLTAIRIYSLHRQKFSEYTLLNPMIRSFKHGQHATDSTDSILTHEMSIDYEYVLYNHGEVSIETDGFATLHYDNTSSPLKKPGQAEKEQSTIVTTLGQSRSVATPYNGRQISTLNELDLYNNDITTNSILGNMNSSSPYSIPNFADANAGGYSQDDFEGVDYAVFKNSGYQQDDATGVDAAVAEQERLSQVPTNYNPTMPDEISPNSTETLLTANARQTSSNDTNQGDINANKNNILQNKLSQLDNQLSTTETGLTNLANSSEATSITISKVNTQYQAALALPDSYPGKQTLVSQLNQELVDLADTKSTQQGLVEDYTTIKSGLVQQIQTTKAELDASGW